MFRSIRQFLSGASGRKSRRKALGSLAPRRLGFEGLEGRKMLTSTITAVAVGDSSFETPALAAGSFAYAPGNTPWQFSALAGISSNSSAFTWGNPAAPDGSQVAFIQSLGSMSQLVNFSAGAYSISFQAAQRDTSGKIQNQEIRVLVDGVSEGTVTPASSNYGSYQTANFMVTAGVHTIEFAGLDPAGGDNTAFVDEVAVLPATDSISDGSFAAPGLPAKSYQYAPGGSSWQFSASAGVAGNGSAFTAHNPGAPQGTQVAFIQGTGNMNQSVYLDAGAYSISFQAAQRVAAGKTQDQEIRVLVDGGSVALLTPASSSYGSYQTANFTVAAGVHTVEFLGINPAGGDNTAFLDEVAVAPAADSLSDGSFATPAVSANGYQYAPNGSSWQFSASAGVAGNGSAFTASNPPAPQGNQVAFLQGTGNMSQSAYLDAGSYVISFQAAQRAGKVQAHYQEIAITVDGAPEGTVTPSGTSYGQYASSNFMVSAGTHVIEFAGLNPQGGDNTAFLDGVSISPLADTVSDAGFEAPGLPANGFQYAPNGSAWQFSVLAGVAANGSAFTAGNPAAPQGVQVAFLQETGSMSQSVYLDGGTYTISFQAAQRAGKAQTSSQEIAITVDGTPAGAVTPTSTSYGSYESTNFTVSAGTHVIKFAGVDPQGGDNTAFLDSVSISPLADTVGDGGFETPQQAANGYQYAPNGSPWKFSATAGVSGNGSTFTSSNPAAPQGDQVAFIQGTGNMSQTVYLDAGTYALSFQAAQRAGSVQTNNQEIGVLVDGASVGQFTPAGTSYAASQTSNFTVAAGLHTIEFEGLDPLGGDNTAFVDAVTVLPPADSIADGSFERPGLAAKSYDYAPGDSPWQFNGQAGVSSNQSAFTAANPNAPDGDQVAFLENNGSMSQSVKLSGGVYSISFQAAQRGGPNQTHYQEIQVLLDGNQVGLVTPVGTNYALYQTPTFTATAGPHVIELLGLNPLVLGDNTALIDEVALVPADTVSDGSFEAPGLAANTYQVAPGGSPWQFTGSAGVASNGSTLTASNPNAPDGTQVAFLQDTGSISQTLLLDSGTYSLTFLATQSAASTQSSYQEIQVLVDGVQVGLVTPTGTNYGSYQTSTFTVTSGLHTIQFVGVNPQGGENTAFLDDVQIS